MTAPTPTPDFLVSLLNERAADCENDGHRIRAMATKHPEHAIYGDEAVRLETEARGWRWLAWHLPELMADKERLDWMERNGQWRRFLDNEKAAAARSSRPLGETNNG